MRQLGLMDGLPLLPGDAAFHEWGALENITVTFLKCTRWQVEETTDIINCRYHYFCDSTYPGDYPPIVGLSVLLFAVASYLSAAAFIAMKLTSRTSGVSIRNSKRRYLVPSGPLALPLILLILARGHRINTMFPLSHMGPALLQLVYVSALAFENHDDKYVVLEASTVSGILHASLYLDSIILPYYTGLEALTKSTFSGECESCVCRRDALVVGGKHVSYRGWSKTTLSVISTMCTRMLLRIFGEGQSSLMIKMVLEGMSWLLIASDSIYLMIIAPQVSVLDAAAHGGICVLIFLNVLKKLFSFLAWLATRHQIQKINLCQNNV